ncbi:MAG TPA: hypothetical protein VM577_21355 [Anaerovoracaceae bacterium]|nr:hypothetical protein [Anaerovoracaceae bacterium]
MLTNKELLREELIKGWVIETPNLYLEVCQSYLSLYGKIAKPGLTGQFTAESLEAVKGMVGHFLQRK